VASTVQTNLTISKWFNWIRAANNEGNLLYDFKKSSSCPMQEAAVFLEHLIKLGKTVSDWKQTPLRMCFLICSNLYYINFGVFFNPSIEKKFDLIDFLTEGKQDFQNFKKWFGLLQHQQKSIYNKTFCLCLWFKNVALKCVSRIVAFIVKNIDTIIFYSSRWVFTKLLNQIRKIFRNYKVVLSSGYS